MIDISILIPAYNEEQSIGKVIDEIKKVCNDFNYEIIVVDDGSKDDTVKIAKEKSVTVISHNINMGYGSAIKTGLRHTKYDIIIITDADGTYPIDKIPELVSYIPEFDMVVGSRTGKDVKIPFIRKPAKTFLKWLAEYLVESKIPDLNSGMRVFKKDCVMEFINLLPKGFSFTTTITLSFLSNGYNIKYVPINYYKRIGKSKINPLRETFGFLLLIIRIITYFNPLKVFVPASILLFLIGLIILLYTALILHKVMDITVIVVMLSSINLFSLGLLADLIVNRGKKRDSK